MEDVVNARQARRKFNHVR